MKLLHLKASPRNGSRTLALSNEFISSLKEKYSDLDVEELDLFTEDLPPVTGGAIDAKYSILMQAEMSSDAQSAWQQITNYVDQFLAADIVVITAPMWNFGFPYKLKHYIDVIVQPGKLFNFTATGVEGLAAGKKVYCITSRGNDYSQEHMVPMDFQEPYLRSIFGFAGITDISFIKAQPLDISPEIGEASLNKAKGEAQELVASA